MFETSRLWPRHYGQPDGQYAYLLGELSLSVLKYNADGSFTLQTVSTIPADWTEHEFGGATFTCQTTVSLFYTSNRGQATQLLGLAVMMMVHQLNTFNGFQPRISRLRVTQATSSGSRFEPNTDNDGLPSRQSETG